MKLEINKEKINELDNKYSLTYIELSSNKEKINELDIDELEIELIDDLDDFNDIELMTYIKVLCFINYYFKGSLNDELIDEFENELNKRYSKEFINLIYHMIYDYIIIDGHEIDIDKEIIIKNIYLSEIISINDSIDLNYKNNYYDSFYDEIIDYIYIYDKEYDYDDLIDYLNELFEINYNSSIINYIDYESLIDDLIIDGHFYELECFNSVYIIDDSYF